MRKACLLLGFFVCAAAFSGRSSAQSMVYGQDAGGRPVVRLAASGKNIPVRAVVLFFVASDCPISNRYAPEIRRLEGEFASRGVDFWLVYPNVTETAVSVTRHEAAFGLSEEFKGRVLLHPQPRLMGLAPASITPESAVLVPQDGVPQSGGEALRAVYVGRIDDRYLDIGRERPQATRHDLEAAIESVLKHEPVAPPGGPPVGCGIVSEAALHSGAGKP